MSMRLAPGINCRAELNAERPRSTAPSSMAGGPGLSRDSIQRVIRAARRLK